MFLKILVALDNAPLNQQVLTKALDIAKADQASLMLLHVLSFDDSGCPTVPVAINEGYFLATEAKAFEDFFTQWQTYEQRQLQFLQSQQVIATSAGVKSEITLTKGVPGRVICELAKSWQADLIIVGRRGRSGLGELLMGSVSNYVTHHAPCSVLIVQ
jgi:nucleotide-binding universal stress UspA family protein